MQLDKTKSKRLAIIFWILTGICFCIIFYFSNQSADESAMQSGILLKIIRAILGDGAFSDFIVRKCAHFLEYVGTCFIVNWAWMFTRGKIQIPLAIATASLYAVTDEVHQIFIAGRSCELRDWAIDTSGAIVGAIAFYVIYKIILAIVKKKKSI